MNPSWIEVALGVLALLQAAALWLATQARQDRRDMIESIDGLSGEVRNQNNRLGVVESRVADLRETAAQLKRMRSD